ncbi:MAG: hypothetical protein JO332_18320, partial [Planctomycetaceae bacterium]|nr:hypothetical protein [Planctomycetaceae bacterium]
AKLLHEIAEARGNVMEVIHNRTSAAVPIGRTGVEILIETRDATHIDELEGRLRAAGYPVQRMP